MDVNLKFIWDVVSQIKIGRAGQAFVVDGQGALIAHPDISLVLQKTNLSGLDHVKAALAGPGPALSQVNTAHNFRGEQVLTAHSTIRPLGWTVFVEQPLGEALEPVRASATRTGLLIVLGMALSIVASLFLARRMVRPIRALQAGAERVGAGELGERIDVRRATSSRPSPSSSTAWRRGCRSPTPISSRRWTRGRGTSPRPWSGRPPPPRSCA